MNSKKRFICASAAALVIWSLAPQAGAQTELGSEWTYQGLLKLSSDPLNDTADFEFTLWDADVDGNMIGALVPVNNVNVVDGLFTTPLDFGVNALNGDKRWLGIAVRSPAGGGEFTTLDPRQALTGVPYAIQTRGIFVDDAGQVGIGTTDPLFTLQVVGPRTGAAFNVFDFPGDGQTRLVAGLAGNGSGAKLRFSGAPQGSFQDIGQNADGNFNIDNALVVEHDTGNVGIGTTTPTSTLDVAGGNVSLNGGWLSGDGENEGVFVLGNGKVGIGTIFPQSKFGVAGGIRVEGKIINSGGLTLSGGGGSVSILLDEDGGSSDVFVIRDTGEVRFQVQGNTGTVTAAAFVGDGSGLTGIDLDPTNELQTLAEVLGQGNDAGGAGMLNLGNVGIGNNANIILEKDDNTFSSNIVFVGSGTQYNFGTPNGDRLRIWNSSSGEVFTIRPNGNVGIGTASPTDAILDVEGDTHINDNDIFLRGGSDRNHGLGWYGGGKAFAGFEPDGPILFGHRGGALGTTRGAERIALRWDNDLNVVASGQFAANCVVINGGCDLAEPFEVTGASVEPGMLVSIDPENPGQLRLTRNAYDTMVAGVASGAGGINVGMTLSQEGLFDQGQPVALVGRVYCWCDASNGPIRPGDLLTSSDTPGHAMSVTDRERAFGTTIGKAMSPLKSGKGLVLVLVNLQ